MFTYEYLAVRPDAFRSLCGLSVAEFDVLFPKWLRAEQEKRAASRRTRREKTPRQRAPERGDRTAWIRARDS